MEKNYYTPSNLVEKLLIFTCILLLFQITRNINLPIYVVLLFGSYILLFALTIIEVKNQGGIQLLNFRFREFIFILTLIYIPIISIFYLSIGDYLVAFPRFAITFPIIIYFLVIKRFSKYFIFNFIRAYVLFMSLAGVSIIYQIEFGAIPFFAEQSMREGVIRYASLAGSLTAYGTLANVAVLMILFLGKYLFPRNINFLLLLIIIAGNFLSLQKASIANLIICVFSYLLFSKSTNILNKAIIVIIASITIFCMYYLLQGTIYQQYVDGLINFTTSDNQYGAENDLINRFTNLPQHVMEYNDIGFMEFISGIGFKGLGGIMGLSYYPQAHNNFFDLVYSGGIFHFMLFLMMIFSILNSFFIKTITFKTKNELELLYFFIIIIIIANMSIGAFSFYQPINAIIIFFVLSTYETIKNDILAND